MLDTKPGMALPLGNYILSLWMRYNNIKKVYHSTGQEFHNFAGIIINKNWPFKKIFNDGILRLRELGTFKKLEKEYVSPIFDPNLNKKQQENVSLGYEEVFLCFGILIISTMISIIVLMLEKYRCIF